MFLVVDRGEEPQTPINGRVIDKRLTDELGDRIGLIVDGTDGRVHHVAFRDAAAAEETRIGTIVEVSRTPSQRPADRNIAIVATDTGVYRPSDHRKMLEAGTWQTLMPFAWLKRKPIHCHSLEQSFRNVALARATQNAGRHPPNH